MITFLNIYLVRFLSMIIRMKENRIKSGAVVHNMYLRQSGWWCSKERTCRYLKFQRNGYGGWGVFKKCHDDRSSLSSCKWGQSSRKASQISRGGKKRLAPLYQNINFSSFFWFPEVGQKILRGPAWKLLLLRWEKNIHHRELCPDGQLIKRVHRVQLFSWLVYKKMYSRPWNPNEIHFYSELFIWNLAMLLWD